MLGLAILCLVLLGWILIGRAWGWESGAFAASVVALCIAPAKVVAFGMISDTDPEGVAPVAVTVSTWSMVLLVAVAGSIDVWRQRFGVMLGPVVICLAGPFIWGFQANIVSGLVHLMSVALFWLVGVRLGPSLYESRRSLERLTLVVLCVLVVLGSTVVLQVLSGHYLEGYNGRASGLFGHPSIIGKISLVLIMLILPATGNRARSVSNRAYAAVALAIAIIVPTQSRGNLMAAIALVFVWVLWNYRLRGMARLLVAFGAVALPVAYLYSNQLSARVEQGLDGDPRADLLAAGSDIVSGNAIFGVGPNNFVPYAAVSEQIVAATGHPVHNLVVLSVAELGLVGVVLFYWPCLWSVRRCLVVLKTGASLGALNAKAGLLLVGITLFVGLTGWGGLRAPTFQLTALALGILVSSAGHLSHVPLDSDSLAR